MIEFWVCSSVIFGIALVAWWLSGKPIDTKKDEHRRGIW